MAQAASVILSIFLFVSLLSGKLLFPSGVSVAVAVACFVLTSAILAVELMKNSQRFGHLARSVQRFFGGSQLDYTVAVVVTSISFVGALLNWTLFFQGRHAAHFFIPAVVSLGLTFTALMQAVLAIRPPTSADGLPEKPNVMNPVVPDTLKPNRPLA